jgi:hypothetical protein
MSTVVYRHLTLDEVNSDEFVEGIIAPIVESFFVDEPMGWIDLCDRVDDWVANPYIIDGDALRYECRCTPDQPDDPVVKRIVAIARKIKRELNA